MSSDTKTNETNLKKRETELKPQDCHNVWFLSQSFGAQESFQSYTSCEI